MRPCYKVLLINNNNILEIISQNISHILSRIQILARKKMHCVLVDNKLFTYSIVQAVLLDTVLNVPLLCWLCLCWMLLLFTNTT